MADYKILFIISKFDSVMPTSLKIIPVLYKPAYGLPQGTGGGVQVVQDTPG